MDETMARRASGEGSIGRRQDGTYYGAIRLDGQRHWAYGETRREVADKLKELRRKQGISRAGEKGRAAPSLPGAPGGFDSTGTGERDKLHFFNRSFVGFPECFGEYLRALPLYPV